MAIEGRPNEEDEMNPNISSNLVSNGTTGVLILRRIAEALTNMGVKNVDTELLRLCPRENQLAELIAWQFLRTSFRVVDEFRLQLGQDQQVYLADLALFETDAFYGRAKNPESQRNLLDHLSQQGKIGGRDDGCLLKPARRLTATEAREILGIIPCSSPASFVHLISYVHPNPDYCDKWSLDIEGCPSEVTLVCVDVVLEKQSDLVPIVFLKKGKKPRLDWHNAAKTLPKNSLIVSVLAGSFAEWANRVPYLAP
jgi:hypothetical protein